MNKTRTISSSIEELSSTLTYIELVLIGIVLIIVCAATVIGNALVLASFALDRKLRTPTNYFLLSLAVSDIMIGAFSMPLFAAYLLIGEWTFGSAVCDIWLAQDYTCSNASCLNLLMIALDRYFSVTDPLRYRAKRTARRVTMMIGIVWTISFLLWPPWIYAWPYIEGRRTVPEDDCYIQFLETNTYVTVITVFFDYYLPVLIILALYYRIWKETKKRSRYLADMETGYQSESICLQPLSTSSERDKNVESPESTHQNNSNLDNSVNVNNEAETALLETGSTGNGSQTTSESTKSDNNNLERLSANVDRSNHIQSKISTTQRINTKHDKAARVLTVILLAFIVTTIPYNIIVIIKNLDTRHSIVSDGVWYFFYYLFYVNSTLNPLCYALANENFRTTYWKILTCSWNRKPQGTYSISSYSTKSSESKL